MLTVRNDLVVVPDVRLTKRSGEVWLGNLDSNQD